MPQIHPIRAIEYSLDAGSDLSSLIAPPYDVLDERSKGALLETNPHNVVKVDLPHLPPKTVGPDEAYEGAAATFTQWLREGVLQQRQTPAIYIYQQTYDVNGQTFGRRGVIANVQLQAFGAGSDGLGGIFPHEQTFSAPKADRLKLMKATKTQLSPIFGLYADKQGKVGPLINSVVENTALKPSMTAKTTNDGVYHEVWTLDDPQQIADFAEAIGPCDAFIADGHHRYGTALNYQEELGPFPEGHSANQCLFVLVAMEDPGLVVLPTHRVLGSMKDFSIEKFKQAAAGKIAVAAFEGDLAALEAALPAASAHAMGIVDSAGNRFLATPAKADPLADSHGQMSPAWRELDVAILQHLIVEQICEPTFCDADAKVTWKFPHNLDEVEEILNDDGYQVGFIMQPTPLEAIGQVCSSGELMPQKSTFFYPKLATGLVVNPLS